VAAGGGGGVLDTNTTGAGLGGSAIGGVGGSNTAGTSGAANTGSGGGGGGRVGAPLAGGLGGSGVIEIAYPDTFPALTITGGTFDTLSTRPGYRVYRILTGSGQITVN